jgi:hypothetical protein
MKLYNNIMMYYLSDSSTDTAPGGSRDNLIGGDISDGTGGTSDMEKCVSEDDNSVEDEGELGQGELKNLRVSSPDDNW